jgi:hypothetical protein
MGAHVALDARAQLLAALVAEVARAEALNGAKVAADRAAEMLASAEARADDFSGLDREIERDTASRIASWASSGGEQPSLDPDPKFVYALARRTECQQRAAAARSAVSTLSSALEDAKRKFVESDHGVSAAATEVMISQARPLAARLVEARREVWAFPDRRTWHGARCAPPSSAATPRRSSARRNNELPDVSVRRSSFPSYRARR